MRRLEQLAVVVLATIVLGLGVLVGAAPPAAAAVTFTAKGSVNQVYTFGHPAGRVVTLLDAANAVVATKTADAQGAALFRNVTTGTGYKVRTSAGTSSAFSVMGPADHPPASFYAASTLVEGFNYIKTRDGTLLSANVTFPTDGSSPPWPVVVNYSGYDPSEPTGPPTEAIMYPDTGYVTVGVNVRGTTCSGGAFDYFEYLQSLDGYDVIETLAAQSWSTGDVGMVGVSYSGISQLFVAQTQPPHLRAITPLSTIDDMYRGITLPGGVLNNGFPLDWAKQRDADAKPQAHTWVKQRISGGDTTCKANQVMRLQSTSLAAEIVQGRPYETRGDYLAPRLFVDRITAPTYLQGAFQDEQTGGHWPTMISSFSPSTFLRVSLTNGTHIEGYGPDQLQRVMEFVDFFVGKRIPKVPQVIRDAAPALYEYLMALPNGTLQPDRFDGYADYQSALDAYRAEPPVRVYWDNGAGRDPGEPYSSAQSDYASWPPPGITPTPYYFGPDGVLGTTAPTVPDDVARGVTSYVYDPGSKPRTTFSGSTQDLWAPLPAVNWTPLKEGNSSSFVSEPLATPLAIAGPSSADLWIRSNAPDVDLEVTITEVRPDGGETFVQSGWLKAKRRAVDPAQSSDLVPFHTYLAADEAPLVPGEWALARVEMLPVAHVFRAGSRLRINVEVPGGNQAFWAFAPIGYPGQTVVNDLGQSVGRPSRIMLPVLPEVPPVPEVFPACPALRGEACRAYVPARRPSGVAGVAGGGGLAVRWVAPPSGGTPDLYRVQILETGASFDVPGDQTEAPVPDPLDGQTYTFRVQAVYGGVAAPASDASLPLTFAAGPVAPTAFDFDGDGSADRGVFRNGGWLVAGQATQYFGLAGDVPVPADYDGDGSADRAVFRNGAWLVQGQATVYLGLAGDVPVPADYDGDGSADRAVYRKATGAWFVQGASTVYFGLAGDVPVPADYDGDGVTDRAVFRNGAWLVQGQAAVYLGLAGDVPVPADYDGDGSADRAVYRKGAWFVEGASTVYFGLAGDVPVPADYDGDGSADRGVYRRGGWLVQGQATQYWGLGTDRPLPISAGSYAAATAP